MKRSLICIYIWSICSIFAALLLTPTVGGDSRTSGCPSDNIDLQILTDHRSYSPGTIMHIKLVITNRGDVPLYIFRAVDNCSSQLGWFGVIVYDWLGHEVDTRGCSGELDMERFNAVQVLSDPKTGTLLKKDEIYGQEQEYELPRKKGLYRLQGEIVPGSLPENQKQELSQRQMRVLKNTCLAPVVTISIR